MFRPQIFADPRNIRRARDVLGYAEDRNRFVASVPSPQEVQSSREVRERVWALECQPPAETCVTDVWQATHGSRPGAEIFTSVRANCEIPTTTLRRRDR